LQIHGKAWIGRGNRGSDGLLLGLQIHQQRLALARIEKGLERAIAASRLRTS